MKNVIINLLIFLMFGCYGVNEKTTEIGMLSNDCMDENAWKEIAIEYSVEDIRDSLFLSKLNVIRNKAFETEIYFFSDPPKELIAISKDHYSIRYVFNPFLSNKVLSGLSSKLDEKEKIRITNRIQRVIMNYQCSEGKEISEGLMGYSSSP